MQAESGLTPGLHCTLSKMAMPSMDTWTPGAEVQVDLHGDKYNEKCGIFGCWVPTTPFLANFLAERTSPVFRRICFGPGWRSAEERCAETRAAAVKSHGLFAVLTYKRHCLAEH
jgi:hypothetical protein